MSITLTVGRCVCRGKPITCTGMCNTVSCPFPRQLIYGYGAPGEKAGSDPGDRIAELCKDQVIRLDGWLAQHEPEIYRSGSGDTADKVLQVLAERQKMEKNEI